MCYTPSPDSRPLHKPLGRLNMSSTHWRPYTFYDKHSYPDYRLLLWFSISPPCLTFRNYNSVVLCPSWRVFQHAMLNNMGCPWYKLKATLKHDIIICIIFCCIYRFYNIVMTHGSGRWYCDLCTNWCKPQVLKLMYCRNSVFIIITTHHLSLIVFCCH